MATFTPSIFRSYDVRGVWGKDFDAAFAQQLGSRIAAHLKGPILIGRDARASSDEISYAVIDGAMHTGAKVIDVGQVSSPQFYWAIREYGASGGIMVTASHNPDEYNGFKVIGSDGQVVGGHEIRQMYDAHPHEHQGGGHIEYRDLAAGYAQAVIDASGWQGQELSLSVDAPAPVRKVLEMIAPIAPDHGLAAKFDADGDRVVFYDNGRAVPADWIFLLLTEHLMFESVGFDLRFSRAVRERLDARMIPYQVCPVGRLSMTQAMHQSSLAMAGEISGHYYWRGFDGMECPEFVLLLVARIVAKSRIGLGQLIAPYIKYSKSEEVNIPVRDRKEADALVAHVARHYRDARISTLDGLTVEHDDWWFNVRPSNTEPVLRMVVEAVSKKELDQRVEQVLKVLS